MARVEQIVKFGATDGQDLACLIDGQKKFRRRFVPMMGDVSQDRLVEICVWFRR
jgi:hypothetical protein